MGIVKAPVCNYEDLEGAAEEDIGRVHAPVFWLSKRRVLRHIIPLLPSDLFPTRATSPGPEPSPSLL